MSLVGLPLLLAHSLGDSAFFVHVSSRALSRSLGASMGGAAPATLQPRPNGEMLAPFTLMLYLPDYYCILGSGAHTAVPSPEGLWPPPPEEDSCHVELVQFLELHGVNRAKCEGLAEYLCSEEEVKTIVALGWLEKETIE